MKSLGIEFGKAVQTDKQGDGAPEFPASADADAPRAAASSAAELKSNVFRMRRAGFDVGKHIVQKKEVDDVFEVLSISENGITAQKKLHGDLVGEEISIAWLQPPRRPCREQGGGRRR